MQFVMGKVYLKTTLLKTLKVNASFFTYTMQFRSSLISTLKTIECVCVCGWWIGNFAVDDLEFQKKTHKVHIFV